MSDDSLYSSVPGYVAAADNHNIGSSGTSWLDPETYTNAVSSAGKFVAVSVLSGLNSFYSSGVAVGNWMGANIQETDANAFISGLDSDLGRYYRQNQEWADVAGFVMASIVPGVAGVKVLNMGQKALMSAKAGMAGGNIGKAMGLLVPNTERYIALSAQQINASLAGTKLLNTNTAKALASGIWQNTLEAAAFETAVQAVLFKSPVLENQDIGDVAYNIAVGGAFGAAGGLIFNSPGVLGKIKAAVGIEREARLPFSEVPSFTGRTPESSKIIQLAWDSETSAIPFPAQYVDAAGAKVTNNYAVNKELYAGKLASNAAEKRTAIHNLTDSKDGELANIFADVSLPSIDVNTGHVLTGQAQATFEAFSGAVAVGRAGVKTSVELKAAAEAAKTGTDTLIDARIIGLVGEDAGKVLTDMPAVYSLADRLGSSKEVLAAVKLQGHSLDTMWDATKLVGKDAHLQAEGRQIWASRDLNLDMIGPKTPIHEFDLPVLERVFAEEGKFANLVVMREGKAWTPGSNQELFSLIKENKEVLMNETLKKMALEGSIPMEQGTVAAAKIANVKLSYAEGARDAATEASDLFAHQSAQKAYEASFQTKGMRIPKGREIDHMLLPKYARVAYRVDKNLQVDTPAITDAITYYAAQEKLYQASATNVASKVLGTYADNLGDMSIKELARIDHVHAGAGLITSANSNYGSLGSRMQQVGLATQEALTGFRKTVSEALEGPLVRLGAKPEAAIEFSGIDQKISRTGKLHVLHEADGAPVMLPREMSTAILESKGKLSLQDFAEHAIPIENQETIDAIRAHIQLTGKRTGDMGLIRAQQGFEDLKHSDVFRPIRRDLKDFNHFAFVRDDSVTSGNHLSMVHAASERELDELLSKVPTGYTKIRKADVEAFKKAEGVYEYSRGLNENYINSELASKGVMSDFFPKSDPTRIVDSILQQHYKESDTLVREAVRLRYQPVFDSLTNLGDTYAKTATSKFSGSISKLSELADNPYYNHIKTGLNISKLSENSLLHGFNKLMDGKFSQFSNALKQAWAETKTPQDLERINAALDKYAIKPAYYDAALQIHANHVAPKGELTKFVRQGNSLLSMFTLGLDPTNSLVNAVGANVLRMTELTSVMRAAAAGNTDVAGALGMVKVPGTDSAMVSAAKMYAKAVENFWKDDGKLLARYKAEGLTKGRAEQLKLLVDDLTLKGTETVKELDSRMATAFKRAKELTEKGEKLSGNPLVEEFNRVISANVMEQMTDLAIAQGKMTPGQALAYRNTFVNRVEGNMLASQRPLIFQGPIGQAVGLFQSYQFNLLQQLFRYSAEGSAKDLAMMAGLQSTLFGIQSLPGFHAINVHVIGQMGGNKEHKDAYDAAYGIAGKEGGDWLLYGLPSNMLQANLYTRGDINPRTWTVIPTSLQETPIVAGWAKFFGSVAETVGKLGSGNGNAWQDILSGLEHNGISRPLAGFAQTLRGMTGPNVFSTSNNGSLLYQNDLFSWASMVRLAGARPLDEALANDGMFRVKTYEAARRKDMKSLSESVRSTLYNNSSTSQQDLEKFAAKYVELGGKQLQFNRYMAELYKTANVSQAELLATNLKSPFVYKMQLLMGGSDE